MKLHPLDDTITAISTPIGEGGIGIVRLSGKEAIAIADKVFKSQSGKRLSEMKSHTVHYGWIVRKLGAESWELGAKAKKTNPSLVPLSSQLLAPSSDEAIDEVLVTVMRSPKSYTAEDMVEISCHGGMLVMRRILDLLVQQGARLAEPGEFTKRAFLNGRIDLVQAEAVLDIIRSQTDLSLRVAMNQLEGHLSKKVRQIREELLDLYAYVEASVDFPDEDLEILSGIDMLNRVKKIKDEIHKLSTTAERGQVLREGVMGVICGKPNVGKSSLLNALLGRERAIVTPIPGTTRDTIEEVMNLDGIPMRLVDTAGIRESEDTIEKEGIRRSRTYFERADLLLTVLDGSASLTREDEEILKKAAGRQAVIVINKKDLPQRIDQARIKEWINGFPSVCISASQGKGLEELVGVISKLVWRGEVIGSSEELVTNVRHKEALIRADKSLEHLIETLEKKLSAEFVSVDIRDALDAIGEIVGETTTDDLLGRIFSKFCIGK